MNIVSILDDNCREITSCFKALTYVSFRDSEGQLLALHKGTTILIRPAVDPEWFDRTIRTLVRNGKMRRLQPWEL